MLDVGAIREWVVNTMPRPLCPRERGPVLIREANGEHGGRFQWTRKMSPTPGFELRTLQPVAWHHTHYTTPDFIGKCDHIWQTFYTHKVKSAPLYRHWGYVQAVRPIGGVKLYSFLTTALHTWTRVKCTVMFGNKRYIVNTGWYYIYRMHMQY